MTVRTKLTVWYAGVLFVSVVVIGGVAYHEFVIERREALQQLSAEAAAAASADAATSFQQEEEEALNDVLQITLWFGLPAAVVGLAGGWFLMRKALAPIAALTNAAGHVNEHTLHEALPRSGNGDELDRLTEVFNAMTARLDGSFQSIREFTLHASHELKTPLTVLHGELEAALQDPTLSAAQLERCETQLTEVQRLAQIVDGLTLLTKADAGQIPLAWGSVPLDELVQDTFADAQILARPSHLVVALDACEHVTVRGDRNRLRQLLLNLTDNAVKYSEPNGRVRFALRRTENHAELTLSNTGPGLSPESKARAFDRFFRGDASHNKDVDGCGLGLSISQWIVSTHGGTIGLDSQPDKQTTVTVRLPILS